MIIKPLKLAVVENLVLAGSRKSRLTDVALGRSEINNAPSVSGRVGKMPALLFATQ